MYNESALLALEEDVFVFPTSFAQQRLWFLDQLQPGDPPTTSLSRSVCEAHLISPRSHKASTKWFDATSSLRTTFTAQDGEPVQVVAESLTLELPVVDLRDRPTSDREAELHAVGHGRPTLRLTWRVHCCCAMLVQLKTTITCCCSTCITSFPMAGRSQFSSAKSPRFTRLS